MDCAHCTSLATTRAGSHLKNKASLYFCLGSRLTDDFTISNIPISFFQYWHTQLLMDINERKKYFDYVPNMMRTHLLSAVVGRYKAKTVWYIEKQKRLSQILKERIMTNQKRAARLGRGLGMTQIRQTGFGVLLDLLLVVVLRRPSVTLGRRRSSRRNLGRCVACMVAAAVTSVATLIILLHPALVLREETLASEEADGEEQGQDDEERPPVEDDLEDLRVRLVRTAGRGAREVGVVGEVGHVVGGLEDKQRGRHEEVVGCGLGDLGVTRGVDDGDDGQGEDAERGDEEDDGRGKGHLVLLGQAPQVIGRSEVVRRDAVAEDDAEEVAAQGEADNGQHEEDAGHDVGADLEDALVDDGVLVLKGDGDAAGEARQHEEDEDLAPPLGEGVGGGKVRSCLGDHVEAVGAVEVALDGVVPVDEERVVGDLQEEGANQLLELTIDTSKIEQRGDGERLTWTGRGRHRAARRSSRGQGQSIATCSIAR